MPSLKVGMELLLFPAWRNDQNLRVKVISLVMGWESLGGRRFGLLKASEEVINVFKIRNDVHGSGLAQHLGSRAAAHAHESQPESRGRSDIPNAVADRDNAVKIITLVRYARARDGRADDRFARDAVFGEPTRNAMVIDARDAQF